MMIHIHETIIIDYSTDDICIIIIWNTILWRNVKRCYVTILLTDDTMELTFVSMGEEMCDKLLVWQLVFMNLIMLKVLQHYLNILKYSVVIIIMTLALKIMIIVLFGTRINCNNSLTSIMIMAMMIVNNNSLYSWYLYFISITVCPNDLSMKQRLIIIYQLPYVNIENYYISPTLPMLDTFNQCSTNSNYT